MTDVILVLNAGSSSIKFRAYYIDGSELGLGLHGQIEGLFSSPHFIAHDRDNEQVGEKRWGDGASLSHEDGIQYISEFLTSHRGDNRLVAVGHRVVHGGEKFAKSVLATPDVVDELERLTPLAPLHQPHNLKPIRIIAATRPHLPQVACFDTAFHRSQTELAQAFALPESITSRGVRRYGFHGLSYEYIAQALPRFSQRAASGRTIVAHLGNGASMCALEKGRSVASTMGFTAVDGLPMGTRCGSLDPGVLLYLLDELKMDTHAIEDLIYKQSGLLGVSGISGDMRKLLESDAPRARFAVELYAYRIGRETGSLAAALQGLDALVFTAGIGEHSAEIRRRAAQHAAWLGIEIDDAANGSGGPRISTPSSKVEVWTIPTDEELMIARHTREVVDAQ
ncbi:acetate/propionate family kinase [Paraburkholderia sp. SARCC-3016]|uniref:acetate/propionate family kinase n=1 Tax=Paraburkholderia sp. SARCC-3016 TaxID=3058611 RepID=UPI002808A175|nr:acetate/propionate family kinase [Paraburkholderia sp. SARCC-3016]MDQ7978930.1 acetate/propionate family kinase [Paraburkholderia sp. SARCC-3016]